MARFTTRVELHYAGDEDYTNLHAAMGAEGFSRLITSDDGATYHLPTAEYNFEGDMTRGEVLEAAKRAAKSTGRDAEILVTESAGRTWSNLTPR